MTFLGLPNESVAELDSTSEVMTQSLIPSWASLIRPAHTGK